MSYLSSISNFLRKSQPSISLEKPIDPNKVRIIKLENKLIQLVDMTKGSGYDFNTFEDAVNSLESEINEATEEARYSDLFYKIEELKETLNDLKKETDFFEKEDELDLGSPSLDDNDFDEELIASDSLYGDNFY